MKINLLFFFSAFLFSCGAFGQPFQIGHTTITLIDSTRSNRNIDTEVYYPSDVAGNNVPVSTATNDPFPVISFGHGFVMSWDAYRNIREAIVPEGFIIVFPETETGLTPSHIEFGKDIAFIISEFKLIHQDTSSLFYNRIDSMNCVMGHSMGGGSAFLAAQLSAEVRSIATLAPAETNPSAIQAAAGISIPSLIIAGGNDCVTPPSTNQSPMHDSLQSQCKILININGGSHCQMADSNFLCSVGEASCTPQPAITRADQHIVIERYLLPWLKYTLKGDCNSGSRFDSLITDDTLITFQRSCVLCSTTSSDYENNSTFSIDIIPNPFNDRLFIQCNHTGRVVTMDLYSINGSKLFSETLSNLNSGEMHELSLEGNLPAGIYFLRATVDGQIFVRKIIRQ
jgi:pimeloyl-ACP methyl ester carboxylesterase